MNTKTSKPVGRPRRILTPTEKEGFEAIVKSDKMERTETESFYPMDNIGPEDEQVRKAKQMLREGEQDSLSKGERLRMENRAKELAPWLQKRMLTRAQTELRPSKNGVPNYDFRKSVGHALASDGEMSTQFQRVAEEWKNIQRALGRPSWECSLESIRPD